MRDDDSNYDDLQHLNPEERAVLSDLLACLDFAEQTATALNQEEAGRRKGRRHVMLARALHLIQRAKAYRKRDFRRFQAWLTNHFNDLKPRQLRRYEKIRRTPIYLAEGFTVKQLEAATGDYPFLLPALLTSAHAKLSETQMRDLRSAGEAHFLRSRDEAAALAHVQSLKPAARRVIANMQRDRRAPGRAPSEAQAVPQGTNPTIPNDSQDLQNTQASPPVPPAPPAAAAAATPCISTPDQAHIVIGQPAPGWSFNDWNLLRAGLGLAMPAAHTKLLGESLVMVIGAPRVRDGASVVVAAYQQLTEICQRDLGPLGPPPALLQRWVAEVGADDWPLRFGSGLCLLLDLRPEKWRLCLQVLATRPLLPAQKAEVHRLNAVLPRMPPMADFFKEMNELASPCACDHCKAIATTKAIRDSIQRI